MPAPARSERPRAASEADQDIVADRDRLVEIGIASTVIACVVFGALRYAAHVVTGHATPWWGNAGGAVAMVLLFLYYRGDRAKRSSVAVHGTALVATLALTLPAAYGMTSSKWWLALVGFSVVLMGRRSEAIVWSAITLVLLPLVALFEGDIRVADPIGEPGAERAMAGFFFLALLIGVTWAFRRAAQERARALAELAASLERANLVKSRFLAHMSHEIRTPLHGVIAMTDMALEDASETSREQLRTAQQSARTLLGLLTNVLDVTRAESDALVLEPRPFALHRALTDVLEPLAGQARAKGVALVAGAEPGVASPRVGDRVRFGQIVMNLVTNALKFTKEGEVAVHLAAVGEDRVRLTVRDTGTGIPAEKLEAIFEPFAQASVADQRVEGGVGLGLAIVRELARRMNGRVSVESEVGKGSTFIVEVELPRGEGPPEGPLDLLAPSEAPPRLEPPSPQRALEVLVCEDNLVNQKVLLAMLSHLGHAATLVSDGEAGWEAVQSKGFDLVLTDVEMPGVSGIELTRRIRAREADKHLSRIPIVGATAHVGEAEQHRLVDAGMDAHLGKPFTLRELSSVLDLASARDRPIEPGRRDVS